ncbi:CGNR zinc finger domain-containing protein [Cellulomonas sp. 179-A 4D5 NHS]|uniref:CGNR zinc finger domain-containing protein n=1 Tax=Cellulomonas sp. 179-A 4D5 NHS TaxID=3142378 RepID=UPI0039A11813
MRRRRRAPTSWRRCTEAHVSGAWSRLRLCGNPDCRWAYCDSSPNRSGRWCAMGECGDVMKARAYRRRARAGAGPQDGQVP